MNPGCVTQYICKFFKKLDNLFRSYITNHTVRTQGLGLHEVEADVFPFLWEKQKNMSSNCNESIPGNKDKLYNNDWKHISYK